MSVVPVSLLSTPDSVEDVIRKAAVGCLRGVAYRPPVGDREGGGARADADRCAEDGGEIGGDVESLRLSPPVEFVLVLCMT